MGRDSAGRGLIAVQTRLGGDRVEVRVCEVGGRLAEAERSQLLTSTGYRGKTRSTIRCLAMLEAVISDEHRGAVSLESVSGEGATLVLSLPLGAGISRCSARG